jgi:hypothetical protein
MSGTVAQMSSDELRKMIESIVKNVIRQELKLLFDDPDSGLELRDEISEQLKYQTELVANGERGRALDDVIRELELQ